MKGFGRSKAKSQTVPESVVKMLCIYNLALNEAAARLAEHEGGEPDDLGQEIFEAGEHKLYKLYAEDPEQVREFAAALLNSIPELELSGVTRLSPSS